MPLESREHRQALAVLDREGVSREEARRFLWFSTAVWGTFAFLTLWIAILGSSHAERQNVPLLLAVGSLVAAVFLLAGNVGLLVKLWRATRTEERLGITRHVTSLTAQLASERNWLWRRLDSFDRPLILLGLFLSGIGGLALVGEIWSLVEGTGAEVAPDTASLAFAVGVFLFGLACLFYVWMKRAKHRLEAVARVRQRLSAKVELGERERALVQVIERTQILVRRDQAVTRTQKGHAGSVRFLAPFHQALASLEPDDMRKVYPTLRELLSAPDGVAGQHGDPSDV
ncbi:MAG: hypothetical protein AB7N65_23150, partial [Vicinamibacterales bacterium]